MSAYCSQQHSFWTQNEDSFESPVAPLWLVGEREAFSHKIVSDGHVRYDLPLSGHKSRVHRCAAETDTGTFKPW